MTDQDRIRLAEAMGWKRNESPWAGSKQWQAPSDPRPRWKNAPDPFTDANDAYAVHQHFMASEQSEAYKDALFELVVRPRHQYSRAQDVVPWHWPKAALKVIDSDG